jgi:hypothetical protein
VPVATRRWSVSTILESLVNGDLGRIAASYQEQARRIGDEEPHAVDRRQRLNRAAAHLLLALAELDGIPVVTYTPDGWLRDGSLALCPRCKKVREGTASWAIAHEADCGWSPDQGRE